MAVSDSLRQRVLARANGFCEYCWTHLSYSTSPFCAEHIRPVSTGGDDSFKNLASACIGCNGHKYAKTVAFDPETGQNWPFFDPRRDEWSAHFTWSEDFLIMLGLSPTGRATVEALHLNRPAVVKIRRLALLMGEHPSLPTEH